MASGIEALPHTAKNAAALTAMRRILGKETTPPCSEHLFEKFIDALPLGARSDSARNTSHRVYLKLFHPTKPTANPALQYYRDMKARPADFSNIKKAAGKAALATYMLRAAYILRYEGQAEDATWLENVVQVDYPETRPYRAKYKVQFDNDPKLKSLRQRSSNVHFELLDAWVLKKDGSKKF